MNYRLAGPFPLRDDQENPLGPFGPVEHSCYYPGCGWLMSLNVFGGNRMCRVTLDGVAEPLGDAPWNFYIWDDVNQVYMMDCRLVEKVAVCKLDYYSLYPNPGFPCFFGAFSPYGGSISLAFTQDRIIAAGESVFPDGVQLFSGTPGGSHSYVGPGRQQGELFISLGSFCRFYDHVNKKVASRVYRLSSDTVMAYYDTDHDVIVSTHTDGSNWSTSVWGFELVPDHLSAVTVKSGDPTTGGLVFFEVQVLGDQGEVDSGIMVDWTLTGPGILLDQHSLTDSTGYAVCRALYTAAGTSTVEASVTC